MKILSTAFAALSVLLLATVDTLSAQESCTTQIVEHATIPGVKPERTVYLRNSRANQCYTREEALEKAKALACRDGFVFGVLNHIEPPSFWSQGCYLADLGLYRSADGAVIEAPADFNPDTSSDAAIDATGFLIALRMNSVSTVAGDQSRSGLYSTEGGETYNATTVKKGFSLLMRVYPSDRLGVEFGTGYLWGDANLLFSDPMGYVNEWNSQLGLSFTPFEKLGRSNKFRISLNAGADYTRLTFDSEYERFLREEAAFQVYTSTATGWGWYMGSEFEVILRSGFAFLGGLQFRRSFPAFASGLPALDAADLVLSLGAGYKLGI